MITYVIYDLTYELASHIDDDDDVVLVSRTRRRSSQTQHRDPPSHDNRNEMF